MINEQTEELEVLEEMSPEELEALEGAALAAKAEKEERLLKLSQVLVKHRDDAVKFRAASGVEQRWAEDQAYYEGEDESARTQFYKGMTQNTPLIAKPKSRYRSKVFLNITRPYCEIASAKVIEVLSPVDDRMWSIEPTGIPSLPQEPSTLVGAIQLQQAPPDQPPPPDPVEEMTKAAVRAALGAQTWIDDKLQECDFQGQLRAVVDESSRLGTGVMRGPVPTNRITRKVTTDPIPGGAAAARPAAAK